MNAKAINSYKERLICIVARNMGSRVVILQLLGAGIPTCAVIGFPYGFFAVQWSLLFVR